jgi:DNA anti-recombination protein RmuC
VTVAVALLVVASVAVLLTVATQSALWLSIGSVLALTLSWAALRMMWTEVLQSRRENAADRAAAAAAYVDLFSVRAAEHAEFTTAMTERLAEAHLARRELEGLVTQHQARADRAESMVASLERSLASLRAGQADDLAAWDEQASRRTTQKSARSSSRKALKGA